MAIVKTLISNKKRACSCCHTAKVKCVYPEGSSVCTRCERLGLKCVPHVSRQGQGTRRRKKVKTKVLKNEDTVDQAIAITSALTPLYNNKEVPPFGCNPVDCGGQSPVVPVQCPSSMMGCPSATDDNCEIKNGKYADNGICNGMDALELEDTLVCKTITNGMGRDHFGLNFIIREWVALAFSRRSFQLLARASFIAAKMKIPMDDIISNQSPFARATESEPMEFLARDLLLPKGQRKSFGYPIELGEVPWDLLDAVQIDPKRATESIQNRWIGIRWTSQGTVRFWTSPLFARDFATVKEVCDVWEENRSDKEIVDLFLPKSEKGKFAQNLFNLIFVNNKPNMPCFVLTNRTKVLKRGVPEPIEVNVIQTMKLIDLDSMIHYFEIQFNDRTQEHIMGDKASRINKRGHVDAYADNLDDEPIMGDSIEFTDLSMTDEMEEFLKLLSGE